MKILTFDTSTETMYVTIGNDSVVDAFKIIETTEKSYNSAFLIPVIIELLKEQNLTMQDIGAIGVNIGPGSFTGVRASATVAKVMANQLDIPVVGISSMEVYSCLNTSEKDSLVLLDARRGKTYFARYGEETIAPCAMEYEEALEYAKNDDLFIISDKKMSEMLGQEGLECLNLPECKENLGLFLAELTFKYLKEQTKTKWQDLKPLYIQPPPISMPKKV